MLPKRVVEINNRIAEVNARLKSLKNVMAGENGVLDISNLSSEQLEESNKLMAEKKDLRKEHDNLMEAHEALSSLDVDSAGDHLNRGDQAVRDGVQSFADAFMAHEQFQQFTEGRTGGRLAATPYVDMPNIGSRFFRFDNNLFSESASPTATIREADRVRIPLRPGIAFDLFPRIPMSFKTIEWEEGTTRALQTAANARVAEGEQYGEMNILYPVRQATAQDLAVFQGITADQLMDKPGIRQTLDADLDDFLAEQYDDLHFNAPAVAANATTALGGKYEFPGGVYVAATTALTAAGDIIVQIINTETALIGSGRRAPNICLLANNLYGRLKRQLVAMARGQTSIVRIQNGVIMVGEVAVYRATVFADNTGLVGYSPDARARFLLMRQTRITDQMVVNMPRVPGAGLAAQTLHTMPTGRFNLEAIVRAVPQVLRKASFQKLAITAE